MGESSQLLIGRINLVIYLLKVKKEMFVKKFVYAKGILRLNYIEDLVVDKSRSLEQSSELSVLDLFDQHLIRVTQILDIRILDKVVLNTESVAA